jgi:predicted protein tyrosine phosphatase
MPEHQFIERSHCGIGVARSDALAYSAARARSG